MNEDLREYILQWFTVADEDLIATERLYLDNPLSVLGVICFHCQQCAEKYLKAYLAYRYFRFTRTHDLDDLLKDCINFDKDFMQLNFNNLTDFAVDFRYYRGEYKPDINEIDQFISVAKETKELVRSKIKFD